MKKETKQKVVFWLSLSTTTLSALALFGFIIAQTYIRWTVNQNFTFLGGFELEALTLLVLGQVAMLAYIHRSEN